VCIVWTWPSRSGQGQTPERRANLNSRPDNNVLHWGPPHINGVQFAELDSYDIRRLSAMISRNVPNDRIRYILVPLKKAAEGSAGFIPNGYLTLLMFSSIAVKP